MIVADRTIVASSVSVAWADALACLLDEDRHSAVNLTLRIESPTTEDDRIRAVADGLLAELRLQDIPEVANTVFPREWGADLPNPAELAAEYRDHYAFLRELDKANARGTYFGRIIAYPGSEGDSIDQLTDNVRKLCRGLEQGRTYGSIYQFNIYHASKDRKLTRGFPCLAHVGMHVDPLGRLNATAQYRSHDVVAKGYGNYLGLGALLAYVAQAARVTVGELLVIAGGAFFAAPVAPVRAARTLLDQLAETTGV